MLNNILNSCQFVVDNSKYVRIDYDKLSEVATTLNSSNSHWLADSPFGLLDLPVDEIVNFLLVNVSIGGFSFWGTPKWTIKTNDGELDGAFAMMHILINKLKQDKKFLHNKDLSFADFKQMLDGNVEIPLLNQRYENFTYINNITAEKMDGNFYNYIKDIYTDTELFNTILKMFPQAFNDHTTYQDKEVYFFKLAQLLTSDILHIRQLKEGANVDYSHLVGCADYKIPQVLRSLDILVYNRELSDIVDAKQEIESGSKYEVEIRAAMIVAINELSRQKELPPIETNDIIWMMGQDKSRPLKPYHLTRTRYY